MANCPLWLNICQGKKRALTNILASSVRKLATGGEMMGRILVSRPPSWCSVYHPPPPQLAYGKLLVFGSERLESEQGFPENLYGIQVLAVLQYL